MACGFISEVGSLTPLHFSFIESGGEMYQNFFREKICHSVTKRMQPAGRESVAWVTDRVTDG